MISPRHLNDVILLFFFLSSHYFFHSFKHFPITFSCQFFKVVQIFLKMDNEPYDVRFLSQVKNLLETHKLNQFPRRVSGNFWELLTYIDNFLIYWDEYYPPESTTTYTNTPVGKTVSKWINEHRFDNEYVDLPLNQALVNLADERDKIIAEHNNN